MASERRVFHIRKHTDSIWAVKLGAAVISTHPTRDGAVVSCNQLNRAECGELDLLVDDPRLDL